MDKLDGIRQFLIIFFVICVLSGCATMLAPDSDNITIKTNPEGANIYHGANLLGKTPLTYSFKRETFEQKKLDIRMEGYKNQELLLQKTIEDKALYNFVFILTTMGVTSWGIDAATGNMIKYSPDSYLIDLEKEYHSLSQKDVTRSQRFRFVILNQTNLMKDIVSRDGEYLRAYFEMRSFNSTLDNYKIFLSHVSQQEFLLLSTDEPLEFYNNLENIFSDI